MVLPFLMAAAPIIGAGISAVGGYMSAQEARKAAETPQRHSVDYKKMVKDAEAAGFNPLTALRNGGAAGYSVTHNHPALSAISPLGEGLQAIGGGLAGLQWDPYADKRAELEFGLMEAQLENLQVDTNLRRSQSMRVPSIGGSTTVGTSGGFEVAQPEPLVAPRAAGLQTNPDEGWSNAQEMEDRYGDIAGSVIGIGIGVADILKSIGVTPFVTKRLEEGGRRQVETQKLWFPPKLPPPPQYLDPNYVR